MKRQPDPLQKRPPSFSRSLVTLCSSRSSSASFLLLPLSRSLSLPLILSLSPGSSFGSYFLEKYDLDHSRTIFTLSSNPFPFPSTLPSPPPVPRSSSIQPRECPWRGPPTPTLFFPRYTSNTSFGRGDRGEGWGVLPPRIFPPCT